MFEMLITILIHSFWISVIGGTTTLFLFRLYFVLKYKLEYQKALVVLFVPCSIGFYLTIDEKSRLTWLYRFLVVLFFIATFIGSIFIFYMYLELDLI
jgi:predicted Abi (CAAX) family protease